MPPKKRVTESAPAAAAAQPAAAEVPEATPLKRKAEDGLEDAIKKARAAGEVEKDAVPDTRPSIKEPVGFNPQDMTLNVIPTLGGSVLMSLSEGGMQYLVAGARANVGVKSGRYCFEVKLLESLTPAEITASAVRTKVPAPRQVLRVGFSVAGSSLVLGDSQDAHVCFDAEGLFWAGGKKKQLGQRFGRDHVVAVVLNLDSSSSTAHTLSLFRDGERVTEPQPLPEGLRGRTLFPHVAFRNVSVQVALGAQQLKPLPFLCRGLGAAATADVDVVPALRPKDGKYEVIFPVAFPDGGTFDWLDAFLASHPEYVELSDRKILEWAASSGISKPAAASKSSNDKPAFGFGLPSLDDFSAQRVLRNAAAVMPRHYVIMEVKSNLVAAERCEVLRRFSSVHFRRKAHVMMGEPPAAFKEAQVQMLLKDKQAQAAETWKAQRDDARRKKQAATKQKALAEARKKAEENRKRIAEEAKKKAEAIRKKAAAAQRRAAAKKKAEAAGEEYIEEADEEEAEEAQPMAEEAKEEEAKDEANENDGDMDVDGEAPPTVELTEDEQKIWFRPKAEPDLTTTVLNQSFGNFSIPEASEGFEAITFEWQGAEESKDFLRKWVLDRKRTSRVEDLVPGDWFREKATEWMKLFSGWQAKQKSFNNSPAQKKKVAEKKEAGEPVVDEAVADGDINGLADVSDVGAGEPLFKDFAMEDWAMTQLRFEMYVLQAAFKKDVNDSDRAGVHEQHLAFYYNKYFRKTLLPKQFAVETLSEVVGMMQDCVDWSQGEKVLTTSLSDELESLDLFVKLAEEARRERLRRIEAGDETARLKFLPGACLPIKAMPVLRPTGLKPPTK